MLIGEQRLLSHTPRGYTALFHKQKYRLKCKNGLLVGISHSEFLKTMYPSFCFKKSGGAVRFRISKDFSRRSFFTDPTAIHYEDPWTDLSYDVNVVCDKKECCFAFPVYIRHELKEFSGRTCIQ